MISFLKGTLIEKHPTAVIVESGGIGFEIVIPLSTYSQLPIVNERIQLHMHLHIREDAWQLFGFWTAEERALFKLLVSISGIGPKLGITILSGIGIANFKRAVVQRDIASLTGISGIGRKTAERIIIELKEKITIDKECMTDEALPLIETEDVFKRICLWWEGRPGRLHQCRQIHPFQSTDQSLRQSGGETVLHLGFHHQADQARQRW